MTRRRRWRIPAVVQAIDVGDRQIRELLVGELEAAEIHAVHLADRRVVADAEGAHAAAAAEVMLVLLAGEEIPDDLAFAREQPESLGPRDRRPEPGPSADRAVAAKGGLREIEIGFEPHGAAMARAAVGFQHQSSSLRRR